MKQIGIVIQSDNETAQVKVKRISACSGNCSECGGGCGGKYMVVTAHNHAGAVCGDRVELEMPSSKVLGAAMMVYIIPVAVFILGYIAADSLVHSEPLSLLTATVMTGILYFINIVKNRKNKDKYRLIIAKIL